MKHPKLLLERVPQRLRPQDVPVIALHGPVPAVHAVYPLQRVGVLLRGEEGVEEVLAEDLVAAPNEDVRHGRVAIVTLAAAEVEDLVEGGRHGGRVGRAEDHPNDLVGNHVVGFRFTLKADGRSLLQLSDRSDGASDGRDADDSSPEAFTGVVINFPPLLLTLASPASHDLVASTGEM